MRECTLSIETIHRARGNADSTYLVSLEVWNNSWKSTLDALFILECAEHEVVTDAKRRANHMGYKALDCTFE